MITPSYSPTATERVLPRMALDFTTGVLDSRVTVARALNTATRTNSSGFIEVVNANLPRFDYDPVTLASRGLLIEEQRVNSLVRSAEFESGYWVKVGGSVTANSTVAPDGNSTADTYTEDTASSTHYAVQSLSGISAGQSITGSTYFKAGTRTYAVLSLYHTTINNYAAASFNLSTGAVANTAVAGTGISITSTSITPVGGGWYRCTITAVAGGAAFLRFGCGASADGTVGGTLGFPTYLGTSNTLFLWGAQVELGAFATSYIPTTTTSLTRNADVVSMTGTNFSDWYNASEGTFLINANRYLATSGFPRMLSCSDNTAANEIALYLANATSRAQVLAIDNTVIQTNGFAVYSTQQINLCGRFKLNGFAGSLNGGAAFTDSVGTMPVGLTQMTIGTGPLTTSPIFSGHVQKISYWPQGLTNAEVQAFSKG